MAFKDSWNSSGRAGEEAKNIRNLWVMEPPRCVEKHPYPDTIIFDWSLQSSWCWYLPDNSFFCPFASCYLEV